MLVCPQTGFARRPRGEEACTNAHKRREEPYFRRGARASCLPRGSKGHKRAGSSVGKFEHRTGAGAQERGGRPADSAQRKSYAAGGWGAHWESRLGPGLGPGLRHSDTTRYQRPSPLQQPRQW